MTPPLPSAGPAGAVVPSEVRERLTAIASSFPSHNDSKGISWVKVRWDDLGAIVRALTPPSAQPREAGEVKPSHPPKGTPRTRNRWSYDGLGSMNAYAKAPQIGRADGSGFFLSGCTEAEAKRIVQLWNRDRDEPSSALSAPASPAMGAEAMREDCYVRLSVEAMRLRSLVGQTYNEDAWKTRAEAFQDAADMIRALPITPQDQGAGGAVVREGYAAVNEAFRQARTDPAYRLQREAAAERRARTLPDHPDDAFITPPPRPDDRGVMVDHPNDANFEDVVPEPQQDEGETLVTLTPANARAIAIQLYRHGPGTFARMLGQGLRRRVAHAIHPALAEGETP